MNPAALVLLAAMVTSVAGFVVLRVRTGSTPVPLAPPRGSAAAGALYAFTVAFAPWAKESASRHLPSYAAGIAYHLAVFTALITLVHSLFGTPLPRALNAATAVLVAVGLVAGAALLVKRCTDLRLRAISVPEDFFANGLVDLTLVAGLATTVCPTALPIFQIVGAVLLLYAPFGKLRHLLFLLTSRRDLGATLGRRGVWPVSHPRGTDRG
ncbi:MAG: hypothetical protein ABR961_01050 [Thermoanaerobaculaceae bacterium]